MYWYQIYAIENWGRGALHISKSGTGWPPHTPLPSHAHKMIITKRFSSVRLHILPSPFCDVPHILFYCPSFISRSIVTLWFLITSIRQRSGRKIKNHFQRRSSHSRGFYSFLHFTTRRCRLRRTYNYANKLLTESIDRS